MLIRCVKKTAVDYKIHEPGSVIEVTEDLGARLIASGYAAYAAADAPSLERAAESVEVETATAPRKRTRR